MKVCRHCLFNESVRVSQNLEKGAGPQDTLGTGKLLIVPGWPIHSGSTLAIAAFYFFHAKHSPWDLCGSRQGSEDCQAWTQGRLRVLLMLVAGRGQDPLREPLLTLSGLRPLSFCTWWFPFWNDPQKLFCFCETTCCLGERIFPTLLASKRGCVTTFWQVGVRRCDTYSQNMSYRLEACPSSVLLPRQWMGGLEGHLGPGDKDHTFGVAE